MGEIATLVNGVSVYGWSDGQYYASNTWSNIAAVLEYYDVDVCGGHAANGDYHHHGTQARGRRRKGGVGGPQAPPPFFSTPNTAGRRHPKHYKGSWRSGTGLTCLAACVDTPWCLGDQLGDDGSGHSVMWGIAIDGYPIYGPYQSADTYAQSCW